jgi:hypothetical protein
MRRLSGGRGPLAKADAPPPGGPWEIKAKAHGESPLGKTRRAGGDRDFDYRVTGSAGKARDVDVMGLH